MANDFTRMAKKVEKLPSDIRDNMDSAVEDEMQSTAQTARTLLSMNRSIASTRLEASIQHRRVQGSGFTTHAASAMTDYAKFVEYGTGYLSGGKYKAPGSTPPIDNIVSWIVEKGIQPYAYDTIYGLARAIADVIENYGNKAHPFMRPAWKRHKPEIVHESSAALSKSIRRL